MLAINFYNNQKKYILLHILTKAEQLKTFGLMSLKETKKKIVWACRKL